MPAVQFRVARPTHQLKEINSTWVESLSRRLPRTMLVFYIPDRTERDRITNKLQQMGYESVPPENPYWAINGVTISDPDGWRIVLQYTPGLSE